MGQYENYDQAEMRRWNESADRAERRKRIERSGKPDPDAKYGFNMACKEIKEGLWEIRDNLTYESVDALIAKIKAKGPLYPVVNEDDDRW